MSLSYSASTGSTSSSNTTPAYQQPNGQEMDPSNILYNDHQNYQIIFSNDSRFFDTSLHLYKSYKKLGYAPNNKKSKKSKVPTTTHPPKAQSNGYSNHGRSKSAGFCANQEVDRYKDGTLKAEVPRPNDPLIRQRSDHDSSKLRTLRPQEKVHDSASSSSYHYHNHEPWPSKSHADGNSSDDSDIIVTRL